MAARDEECTIQQCVESLLAQEYPNLEVIVVDDRSRDRTPRILRQLQDAWKGEQPSARLQVLTIRDLPEGWFGKSNALRVAVRESGGSWLLFTDADCRHTSPSAVSTAVRYAMEGNVDFLSVTPRLAAPTVWERVLQPVCAIILIIRFLQHRVNNPATPTAYANGAFMLIRRECYEAIGGHAAVRTRLNEDMHLARLAKSQGFRLVVTAGRGLYETRMYRTLRDAWNGWSRIFRGCLETPPRLAFSAFLLSALSVFPWISCLVALSGFVVQGSTPEAPWGIALTAWSVVVLLLQLVLWRLYPSLSSGRAWSLTYLVGSIFTLGMLLHALAQSLGAVKTHWRGTKYH